MRVLITGGAGFIGSRLAHRLVSLGHDVTVIDKLIEQIHGTDAQFAIELSNAARCIRGDIGDRDLLSRELPQAEAIVHLAAETGTGQSMYAVDRYSRHNIQATATLFDVIVNERPKKLAKVVVASSRAVYGEGAYRCDHHGVVYPRARTFEMMSQGKFDPSCPACGAEVELLPTTEEAPFSPSSFYGITKQLQEQMVLMFGSTLGVDSVALRYQNVYGPGQSLSNPYTGLLAVFFSLARDGRTLNVFEDGMESRDFVYVDDAVEATAACVHQSMPGTTVLNIGSGVRTPIIDVARSVADFFGSKALVKISGGFRVGDIRHNVADISRARAKIGFTPRWGFSDGLREFMQWASTCETTKPAFARSLRELEERGMLGTAR